MGFRDEMGRIVARLVFTIGGALVLLLINLSDFLLIVWLSSGRLDGGYRL